MTPHIILLMNKPFENPWSGGIETISFTSTDAGIHHAEIILCGGEDDDEVLIFTSFDAAKQFQDDNAVDGRVVKLPIY